MVLSTFRVILNYDALYDDVTEKLVVNENERMSRGLVLFATNELCHL